MRFLVLGPLQLEENGELIPLGGQLQRAVLALLVAAVGRPISIDAIASEIWPDRPLIRVRDSLYTYVSQIRRAVGKERLVRVDGGYRLDLAVHDEIDAAVFEGNARTAARLVGVDPDAARQLLDQGIILWYGRPYEGFEDLVSLRPEVARLNELKLTALEDRIEAELQAGQTPSCGNVQKLCEEHPYRERLWGLFARTLYRVDRQADALRAFTTLRSILGEELGLDLSPALARLEEQILLHDPALEPDAAPPETNLPVPVSSFVGRFDELVLLDKAIHEHRLVTVVGPGGAGKTRLAIQASHTIRGTFRDGVWFVDLAQVPDPGAVPHAVAAALQLGEQSGVEPTDSIAAYLRPRSALLVLDNCEHVIDAVGMLAAALLEQSPDLHLLATSRVAIGGSGEVRFDVGGLATAPGGALRFDAEMLFEARAATIHSDFAVDEGNRAAVGSICRHLDGMPLAIELAAARIDVLSPAEIDGHLVRRFSLLSDEPTRRSMHRSLRASMDWSYAILPPAGRQAFDAFGVFEGPFSAVAAATVLNRGSEIESVDQIRSLVRASLLHVAATHDGASLYRLLETPRLYARDHLVEQDRWDLTLARHDAHYRDVCATLRPAFFGRGRVVAQREIETEMAEYNAAFDRLLAAGEIEGALEMGFALGQVWMFNGQLIGGERRLRALLDAAEGAEDRHRADALVVASFLLLYRQQWDQANAWADEAISIYRAIGDDQGLAYALARRGHMAFASGDFPTAMEILPVSLELCRRIGFEDGTAWPITLIAQARRWSGEEDPEIRDMLEEGRRRFIAMGEVYGQVHADMVLATLVEEGLDYRMRLSEEMMRLGEQPAADRLINSTAFHGFAYTVWDVGDLDRAEGLNRVAARSALKNGETVNSGLAFLQAATFAGHRGEGERCATLFGSGHAHFTMQMAPFQERIAQPAIDLASHALGRDRYRELHDEGASMTVAEATGYLLSR